MARLHREVLAVLVDEIVQGKVGVGEWLPREVDLAARFGISRGVARECIRALEERDLVQVRHGKGAMVREREDWNVLDTFVLSALLKSDERVRVLGEYLECRRSLEVEAAGLAAERATSEQLADIEAAFRRMSEAAQRRLTGHAPDEAEEEYLRADVDFHAAIVESSSNRALAHMLRPMHHALLTARFHLARPEARQVRGLPEHERVLAAIREGDAAGAREAMSDHLVTVKGYLAEYDANRQSGAAPANRSEPAPA